ncbi:hypothetical protein QCA50_004029 [Cerrena zonata]|uniref:Prefoldin subunit 4 n=1 Tax=Cerrena zonata TaxID=2478898 RepID=A0AAW0GMN2_9APHY
MRMLSQDEEKDDSAEVTWEDQARINSFSKLNGRVKAFEEKIEILKQEKEALDDLSMELELADEDQPIMYRVGESFIHLPHSRAMKRLEKDKTDLDEELSQVSLKVEECETEMKQLKVVLYAKFGKAINLDE